MNRRTRTGAAALLILLSGPALACPITNAVYRPVEPGAHGTATGYELVHAVKSLPANQSDLVVTIRAAGGGGVSHDFGFAFSNGYGRTHLVYAGRTAESATFDPGEDRDGWPGSPILYFDAGLRAVSVTNRLAAAPEYLIMPEIGLTFWYWANGDRTFVPPGGMWKRVRCRG